MPACETRRIFQACQAKQAGDLVEVSEQRGPCEGGARVCACLGGGGLSANWRVSARIGGAKAAHQRLSGRPGRQHSGENWISSDGYQAVQ